MSSITRSRIDNDEIDCTSFSISALFVTLLTLRQYNLIAFIITKEHKGHRSYVDTDI